MPAASWGVLHSPLTRRADWGESVFTLDFEARSIVPRRRLIALLAAVGMTLVLPTCSRSDDGQEQRPSGYEVGKANAPRVCFDLADASALRELGTPAANLATGGGSSSDRVAAKRAAAQLRDLASGSSGQLRPLLMSAAGAVEGLALTQQPTRTDLETFTSAFERLDREVQATCALRPR
jgi:hypothetical protein